jgi:hypothetical protein
MRRLGAFHKIRTKALPFAPFCPERHVVNTKWALLSESEEQAAAGVTAEGLTWPGPATHARPAPAHRGDPGGLGSPEVSEVVSSGRPPTWRRPDEEARHPAPPALGLRDSVAGDDSFSGRSRSLSKQHMTDRVR